MIASDGKAGLELEISAPVGTTIKDPSKESENRYLELGDLVSISIRVSSTVHTLKSRRGATKC